jgi:phosphoserine phosphatase
MDYVATLIAGPGAAIDAQALSAAAKILDAPAEPCWLDRPVAADLFFSARGAVDARETTERIRADLGGRPIDVVIQLAAARKKRLLMADMESTMIGQECLDELAAKVGLEPQIAAITARAMNGEIAFEPAVRERVALLRGLPVSAIEAVLAERIHLNPGARTLAATMRAHGAHTCLVSGGFTAFANPVAKMIGFDEHRANRLILRDGRIEGVEEPILGRDAKLAALLELTNKLGLAPEETLAVGDGANDLAMLEAAGLGIAYHAKPSVAACAEARIDHADLGALLFAQGYRREEFVDGQLRPGP